MLSLFITVAGWLALCMLIGGIVQVMLKPQPELSSQVIAVQSIACVAGILPSIGLLTRAELSLSVPLSLGGFGLAIFALVLRRRVHRTAIL